MNEKENISALITLLTTDDVDWKRVALDMIKKDPNMIATAVVSCRPPLTTEDVLMPASWQEALKGVRNHYDLDLQEGVQKFRDILELPQGLNPKEGWRMAKGESELDTRAGDPDPASPEPPREEWTTDRLLSFPSPEDAWDAYREDFDLFSGNVACRMRSAGLIPEHEPLFVWWYENQEQSSEGTPKQHKWTQERVLAYPNSIEAIKAYRKETGKRLSGSRAAIHKLLGGEEGESTTSAFERVNKEREHTPVWTKEKLLSYPTFSAAKKAYAIANDISLNDAMKEIGNILGAEEGYVIYSFIKCKQESL